MNILITGATGFIGKNFLDSIKQKKWYDLNCIHILTSDTTIKTEFKTITYSNFNVPILPNVFFDIVFHMGASTPKSYTESNIYENSIANITFTKTLLNRLSGKCGKFIFLSTLDVYAPNEKPIDENSSVGPSSLYGLSKLYCEKLVELWGVSENCIIQILRIGHIYGPGEDAYQKIIPITIKNILNNLSPVLYGEGIEKRAFLYIDDCIEMIYRSTLLKKFAGIINIVSDRTITINELVIKLLKIANSSLPIKYIPSSSKSNSISFYNTKMTNLLGKEFTNLETGLQDEFKYFQKLNYEQKC